MNQLYNLDIISTKQLKAQDKKKKYVQAKTITLSQKILSNSIQMLYLSSDIISFCCIEDKFGSASPW